MVAGLAAQAAPALEERFAAHLHGVGDRIEVCVPEKSVDGALALLLEAGAQIVSVAPRRASLEQIFLDAVEGRRR
jgi:hypothetical protein